MAALQDWVRHELTALAASPNDTDADAGRAITAYYLRRGSEHHAVAMRLHLSRATYFRRVRHGLALLAQRLPDTLWHS